MNQEGTDKEGGNPARRSGMTKWIVIGFLLLITILAVMNLPRGYDDDLSILGKGTPAVVLIRDKNAVQSFELMEVLNGIRSKYTGKVNFLLTDADTPEGKAFISASNASRVSVVLVDDSGKAVNVLYAPQSAESMQQAIAGSLGITN